MILDLFIITFVIVYVVGHSGIIIDISKTIYTILNPGKEYRYQVIKPFGCFNCMTWWIVLIYTLLMHIPFILCFGFAALFGGFVSVVIDKLIRLFLKIINKIN